MHVRYIKVITVLVIAYQHHLLFCDFRAKVPPATKKKSVPRLRTWRLREPKTQARWISSNASGSGTEKIYGQLMYSLLKAVEMCDKLSRNTDGQKRLGGGMQLSIMKSMESGDAGKPGRMVTATRNIRRPSASPNMLSI